VTENDDNVPRPLATPEHVAQYLGVTERTLETRVWSGVWRSSLGLGPEAGVRLPRRTATRLHLQRLRYERRPAVIQHPHQLHAQAALWSLRAALRHLDEHRDALLITRPQLGPATTRPRSLASLARHDALLLEEKAERRAGSLNGLKPSAGSAAPGDAPGLADLELYVNRALIEVHGILVYAHRRDPLLAWSPLWHDVLDAWHITRDARWTWLSVVLPATPARIAEAVALALVDADQLVRSYAGLDADLLAPPLAPPCPACDRRRLRIQSSAPDSARWTVTCADSCRCIGDRCGCDMDIRERGIRHIWAADSTLAGSIHAGVRTMGLAA